MNIQNKYIFTFILKNSTLKQWSGNNLLDICIRYKGSS